MHTLPGAIVAPATKVTPHRRPGRKLMGQGAPLAAGAIQVQDGVQYFTHIGGAWMSSWLGGWDQWFKDRPFPLTQIAWIVSSLHHSPLLPLALRGILVPLRLLLYCTIWHPVLPSRSPGHSDRFSPSAS